MNVYELFRFSTLRSISQYANTWAVHLHCIWLNCILVNDWKPLTIITKCSILDVAAALDPPLGTKNLQQLIKLIEQKFISTTWPQYLTLKDKVTQQISTNPKSFLATLKFSFLFIMKKLLNVNLYTWSAFISHVVYLGKLLNS